MKLEKLKISIRVNTENMQLNIIPVIFDKIKVQPIKFMQP